MPKCNTKTKPVPICTTNLIVGTTDYITQSVMIFIEDLVTGVKFEHTGTTTSNGVLVLNLKQINTGYWSTSKEYTLTASAQGTTRLIPIEISGNISTCYQLTFEGVYDGDAAITTSQHLLQLNEDFTPVVPLIHLDTIDISTELGVETNVSVIHNKGSLADADQTLALDMPSLVGADLNNVNTVQFDGGNEFMEFDGTGTNTDTFSRFHWIAAINITASSGIAYFLARGNTNVGEDFWGFFYDFDEGEVGMDLNNGTQYVYVQTSGATLSAWSVFEIIFDSGVFEITINGVRQLLKTAARDATTGIPTIIPAPGTDINLGKMNATAPLFADFKIRSMYLFGSVITPTQRQGIIQELAGKI